MGRNTQRRRATARAHSERSQSGVVLVLTAVVLIGLFSLATVAVDLGTFFVERREAQTAADAGALAAAHYLPSDQAQARAAGLEYVAANMPDATAVVTPGYGGNPNKVEVVVSLQAPTFFARIFGVETVEVGARAVAEVTMSAAPCVVFHNNPSPSNRLSLNGTDLTIVGGAHSNGSMIVNGTRIKTSSATYSGSTQPIVNGTGHDFGGGQTKPTHLSQTLPWPAYFQVSDFTPTYTGSQFVFNGNGQTIPSGVYFASSRFIVNGTNMRGQITVVSPVITINGSGGRFTPYQNNVVFFSTGTSDVVINGNDGLLQGITFSPGGKVVFNGNALTVFNGMIEADRVTINGSSLRMGSEEGGTPQRAIKLVE